MKNQIKKIRERQGIGQKKLAELTGISPTAIFYYENNKRDPSLENAYKLAGVLNVSVYDLWHDETKVAEEKITIRRVVS